MSVSPTHTAVHSFERNEKSETGKVENATKVKKVEREVTMVRRRILQRVSAVSDQHSPVLVLMAGVGCCASRSADGRGGMLCQS